MSPSSMVLQVNDFWFEIKIVILASDKLAGICRHVLAICSGKVSFGENTAKIISPEKMEADSGRNVKSAKCFCKLPF